MPVGIAIIIVTAKKKFEEFVLKFLLPPQQSREKKPLWLIPGTLTFRLEKTRGQQKGEPRPDKAGFRRKV